MISFTWSPQGASSTLIPIHPTNQWKVMCPTFSFWPLLHQFRNLTLLFSLMKIYFKQCLYIFLFVATTSLIYLNIDNIIKFLNINLIMTPSCLTVFPPALRKFSYSWIGLWDLPDIVLASLHWKYNSTHALRQLPFVGHRDQSSSYVWASSNYIH